MGARHYCPKFPRVLGTLGTRANSSPDINYLGMFSLSSKPGLLCKYLLNYQIFTVMIKYKNDLPHNNEVYSFDVWNTFDLMSHFILRSLLGLARYF